MGIISRFQGQDSRFQEARGSIQEQGLGTGQVMKLWDQTENKVRAQAGPRSQENNQRSVRHKLEGITRQSGIRFSPGAQALPVSGEQFIWRNWMVI